MPAMQIYMALTKVDAERREVHGRAAQEVLDKSGEIMDYETSKPLFEAWSQGISEATGGKSLGNVRAMHGKVAAGVTREINFDDDAKHIVVKAEIVDDNEWRKVLKGVYTGFSIGGKYGSKWEDPVLKAQRYEAIPSEYSLVDLPCNPDAQFTVIKADGTEELRKFEATDDAEALLKWADGLTDEQAEALAKKIARRKDVKPKEGEDKYGDVEYADPTNKKYPIDTAAHIHAAWNYIHMPRNAAKYSSKDVSEIKARIIAAWKAKIDSKGPPEAEKFAQFAERLVKIDGAVEYANLAHAALGIEPMEKGLWAVAQFAQLLEQLAALTDGTVYEEQAEGDDSKLPETMRAALKPIAAAFLAMCQEETNEALHGELNDDAALAMAAAAGDLAKVGRKHTRAMREHRKMIGEHLAKAKEHLDAMGADDPADADDDDEEDAEKLAKVAGDLAKVTAERDDLKKQLDEINAGVEELRKHMEQQPAPPKGAVTAVEKRIGIVDGTDNEAQPIKKADGTVDHAATALELMKSIYRGRSAA